MQREGIVIYTASLSPVDRAVLAIRAYQPENPPGNFEIARRINELGILDTEVSRSDVKRSRKRVGRIVGITGF